MDNKRKYRTLHCEICGNEYQQQDRLYKKALWKNRCSLHRGVKFNFIGHGLDYEHPQKCSDCGKVICRDSVKCKSCSHKKRIPKLCIDCGVVISYDAKLRCASCQHKYMDKGKSTERTKFNNSNAWNAVRVKCFERDNHTCQICNNRGGYLNAHHIKSYKKFPLLRLDIRNLITLCWDCHKKLHHNIIFKLNYLKYVS